jgi:hypothetical protein
MNINKTTSFSFSTGNPNFTRESIILNKEQYELLKCEFCDDHIKRRYIDMKEQFYKIFKNYIKLIKFIKNKDEASLKKSIDEIGSAQKELIHTRNFLEKLILLKKNLKLTNMKYTNLNGVNNANTKSNQTAFFNNNNSSTSTLQNSPIVIIEGLDEKERNQFFEELNTKKELIKKFRKNILELETISNNIQEVLENVSLSNSILNNN